MNFRIILLIAVAASLLGGVAIERYVLTGDRHTAGKLDIEHARKHLDPTYVCPMHPEVVSKEQSSCPICGMNLVPVKQVDAMDNEDGRPVVTISSTIMNNIGVHTVPVVRKTIARRIETPGFVQQIRKGTQSHFKAPLAGSVKAFLFEAGKWYQSGVPLIEVESDKLLEAQQRHLELLAATPDTNTGNSGDLEETLATVVDEPATLDDVEEGEDETESALSAEQYQRLTGMGLNDEAIREMERAMILNMQAEMSGNEVNEEEIMAATEKFALLAGSKMDADNSVAEAEAEAEAETDTDKPELEPESEAEPDSATLMATEEGITTEPAASLEESRASLAQLGMRMEDIRQLETCGEASGILTIYTHHPGKVMALSVSEGDELEVGDFLFRLGGQVRATVLANAFQRDAAWIKTGQRAEIRMPHVSGKVWPGIVNKGVVSINPNSQNIGIKLAFDAPFDKVRANLYVVGTVYGTAREDVLAVPSDAVIRTEGEERVVLALGDGRFQPVLVTTGITAGGEVEITEGLEEGDEVVVMAQFLIDSESSLKAGFRRLGGE